MRRAAEITCEGHVRAMRACQPGMTETQLEAELIYTFMRQGAKSPAYSSIVGGGANACVLHYVDNAATLRKIDGEMIAFPRSCLISSFLAWVRMDIPRVYSRAMMH